MSQQKSASEIVAGVLAAAEEGRYDEAESLIAEGRSLYPNQTGRNGNVWSSALLKISVLRDRADQPVSAPPVAVQPVSAPPAVAVATPDLTVPGGPADGGESLGTYTVIHNAERGTYTSATVKGDGSWEVMGKTGQRWNYTRSMNRGGEVLPGYYRLANSKRVMPDMTRIGSMTMAMRNAGFTVLHDISTVDCGPARTRTTQMNSRLHEVAWAARRQSRVTPGMGSDEPVSAPPAVDSAPVSAPPAPVQAVEPIAPVSAWVTVPEVVAEADGPAKPDYAAMTDEQLLEWVSAGDVDALRAAKARMQAAAAARVETVTAPPVAELAPVVTAPASPSTSDAISRPGYVEVWFHSTVTRRKEMKEAATLARGALRTAMGTVPGGRPTSHIGCAIKDRAFKVWAEVPEGVDNSDVIAAMIVTLADAFGGFGAAREPIMAEALAGASA
jgi:hypothetical protein